MKLNEFQRSRSFLYYPNVTQISKLKLFFSETLGSFETKFYTKDYRGMGMQIYSNKLAHMIKMAAMSIYVKKD